MYNIVGGYANTIRGVDHFRHCARNCDDSSVLSNMLFPQKVAQQTINIIQRNRINVNL
jgi:hypothetical protein